MGKKVNPIGFRLAVTKDWRSKWYAVGKNYAAKLHEDLRIRKYIKDYTVKVNSDLKGTSPAISRITIERAWNSVRVTISTARPGLVIGPKGKYIEEMTAELTKLCGGALPIWIFWKFVSRSWMLNWWRRTLPLSWNVAFLSVAP